MKNICLLTLLLTGCAAHKPVKSGNAAFCEPASEDGLEREHLSKARVLRGMVRMYRGSTRLSAQCNSFHAGYCLDSKSYSAKLKSTSVSNRRLCWTDSKKVLRILYCERNET